MRELIERYVREMVKIPSISNTEMEKNCADYIAEELAKQPYFKEHPEQTGKYLLPEDSLGRSVPWGLVKGNGGSRKTISLTYRSINPLIVPHGNMPVPDLPAADIPSSFSDW